MLAPIVVRVGMRNETYEKIVYREQFAIKRSRTCMKVNIDVISYRLQCITKLLKVLWKNLETKLSTSGVTQILTI